MAITVAGLFRAVGSGQGKNQACVSRSRWVRAARELGIGPGLGCWRGRGIVLEVPVTDPCACRQVEIKDGERTVAAAQVTVSRQAGGTARASLHAASGHLAPGARARLVDAVLDLPEVRASGRLRATVPLGDTESLWRLRERTGDAHTRPAGSTALVDADIRPGGGPGSGREPDGRAPRR